MSDPRQVESIWWNGANGDKLLVADGDRRLELWSEYHGDHECEWVSEYVGDKEVARHNARYIASIQFRRSTVPQEHSR